jgi:hypothetical protein
MGKVRNNTKKALTVNMVETVHMGDTDVHKKVLLKLIDLKRIR